MTWPSLGEAQLTDEELFASFLAGNEGMFEALVKRYQKPLYGYLVRYLGNANLAEEVSQETFVKVFEKRHLYQQDRPFKPWLYQIAMNAATDKFRERKHSPVAMDDKAEAIANSDSPAIALERREVAQMIAQAVAELPDHQRQVFILREYQYLSYAEISAVVQRPLNTVKSDMHRALQSLRTMLDTLSE
jgi:RNA polymerase sigma-70 factor (ECF subfamily)